jgi:hypothetical protein
VSGGVIYTEPCGPTNQTPCECLLQYKGRKGMTRFDCVGIERRKQVACAVGRPSRCQRRGRAENRSVGAASGVGGRTKQGVGSCFLFGKTQSSHHVPLFVFTPTGHATIRSKVRNGDDGFNSTRGQTCGVHPGSGRCPSATAESRFPHIFDWREHRTKMTSPII